METLEKKTKKGIKRQRNYLLLSLIAKGLSTSIISDFIRSKVIDTVIKRKLEILLCLIFSFPGMQKRTERPLNEHHRTLLERHMQISKEHPTSTCQSSDFYRRPPTMIEDYEPIGFKFARRE